MVLRSSQETSCKINNSLFVKKSLFWINIKINYKKLYYTFKKKQQNLMKGTKSAENGVELAQSTGDSIRVIREHAQRVVAASEQIAASARQQLAGMDQITRAMENINLGATQTQKGMQQIDQTAQNLNDLGKQLTAIVKQYKIE